eukprot:GHVN01010445.1.p1 GENE.GHVN01010445.1~~GHVN01010445.1.p1  ORF type:complete len:311 (+),score=132.46 GHVN01010445.1:26-934(+)
MTPRPSRLTRLIFGNLTRPNLTRPNLTHLTHPNLTQISLTPPYHTHLSHLPGAKRYNAVAPITCLTSLTSLTPLTSLTALTSLTSLTSPTPPTSFNSTLLTSPASRTSRKRTPPDSYSSPHSSHATSSPSVTHRRCTPPTSLTHQSAHSPCSPRSRRSPHSPHSPHSSVKRRCFHAGSNWDESQPKISVNFVLKDGSTKTVKAPVGTHVLEVAQHFDIDLEGACEASLACSTCHVILEGGVFDALEPASEEEEDLLDLAPGLTPTSRLGCQVYLSPELDGVWITLPPNTVNFYVDGHVNKPH